MVRTTWQPVTRAILLSALSMPIAACSAGGEQVISDDTYIQVMAELLAVENSPAGMRTDSARAEVLERLGVSEEQVLEFARAAGEDPERMERLWTAIQAAVDSAEAAGDSLADAASETRLGSTVTGAMAGDTTAAGAAADSAATELPGATPDTAKIRAIRERLRPGGAPRP